MRYLKLTCLFIITSFVSYGCHNRQSSIVYLNSPFDTIVTIGNEFCFEIRNESKLSKDYRLVRWESFVLGHNKEYSKAIRKDSLFSGANCVWVVNYENRNLKDTSMIFDNHVLDIRINKNNEGWVPLDMTLNTYSQEGLYLSSEYRVFDDSYWLTREYRFADYDQSNRKKYIYTYRGSDPINGTLMSKQEFNEEGRLLSEESPSGKTEFTYNSLGKCLSKTIHNIRLTELYEYDNNGHIVKATSISHDTLDNDTRYEYDNNWKLSSKIEFFKTNHNEPVQDSFIRNEYEYDSLGRLTVVRELTQRDGIIKGDRITRYSYNDNKMSISMETIDQLDPDSPKSIRFSYYSK